MNLRAAAAGRNDRIENVVQLRLRLELMGERDLFKRVGKAIRLDAAIAVRLDFRRDDIFVDRHVQPFKLDVFPDLPVALDDRVDCGGRLLHRVLQTFQEGAQETLNGIGMLGGEFCIDQDGAAIERDPVVRHQQDNDIVDRNTFVLEINIGRERVAGDRIDLARRQHRFAHGKTDVFDCDLRDVDVVGLREYRPFRKGAAGRGRAKRFAFQVFRLAMPRLLRPITAIGRPIVEHEHGFDWRGRIGVAEFDQRVDVAEAHVIFARCDALDGLQRAERGVDRDVEVFRDVVTFVERHQERRRWSFEFEIKREVG